MRRLRLLVAVAVGLLAGGFHPLCAQPVDSLDLKIGQMIMVGFRGLTAEAAAPALDDVARGVGGVILFDYDVEKKSPVRNIESPAQLRALTRAFEQAARRSPARLPLLVAIDQEGGRVNRLKPKYGFAPTLTQEELGRMNRPDSTRAHAARTGATLASLGINLNFAPVVDVNVNPDNPVIGRLGRSFGADPARVAVHAAAAVEGYRSQGVLTAVKHFPGHGSSTGDSHEGFVDVTSTWSRAELVPFARLIASGHCDMVMTAHIFNSRLDARYPATLSRAVIGMLRDSLHWDGVVVSDDLQMRAITDHYGFEEAVALALDAGVDMLLMGNNAGVYDEGAAQRIARTVRGLVRAGKVSEARIDASYRRILALKRRLN